MNKTLKVVLLVLGGLTAVVILLGAGVVLGRFVLNPFRWAMPMHSFGFIRPGEFERGVGPGMMQGLFDRRGGVDFCPHQGGSNWGRGMMGGWRGNQSSCGSFQGMGPGMMQNDVWQNDPAAAPLSIAQAQQAVEEFLSQYGDDDLALAEVMVFDNHAYAEIVEKSTGFGAMEVLVDPATLEVYPEHGPNMMWNQKYSPMGRGMMSGYSRADISPEEMPVSPEEAAAAAQDYLDSAETGLSVMGDHVSIFYGYYTLHTFREGEVQGMLSVNGTTGDVFYHTWHGELLEVQKFEDAHN